jgi:hypothetical protein
MKKMTKITLRTKITLTIVGLLMLTGVLYAANPSLFVMPGHGVFQPIGMAADPTHLYVTQYQDNQIRLVDCNGNGTLFGTLPGNNPLVEKYTALAPVESATALFTPGDLFVTLREQIFRATPPNGTFTPFADVSTVLGGCPFSDHSAITFDKVGTFGFNMIVTCESGRVWQVDHNGTVTHIADTSVVGRPTFIEGPVVLPLSFGPLGGKIMVADDSFNQLYTVDNMGNVTYNPFGLPGIGDVFTGAEQVLVIPEFPCTYCADRAFFQASAVNDNIFSYPRTDFDGLGGDILITSEWGPPSWPGTIRGHFDEPSQTYQFSYFDTTVGFSEGSTFVEGSCPPVTPTPTPTPTPTATPVCQFSASIPHNFNSSPISAGNYIWFTAVLTPANLGTARVTFTFTGQTITIPVTPAIILNVPDATIVFDPAVNFCTTTFGPGGVSTTIAPSNPLLGGWTLFSALVYQVPAGGLPGGIGRVEWRGTLGVDTPGAKVQGWKWAAAVYPNPNFSLDYNAIGVKPHDGNVQNPYPNGDLAGTPENFKTFVISGATGGGATNYVGGYSATKSFTCPTRGRR